MKKETISLLKRATTTVTDTTILPNVKPMTQESVDDNQEYLVLDITKKKNGSYLMSIQTCHTSSVGVSDRMMTPDEIFEAWMVMGHTIKALVGDYRKEIIEYMVKEFRTKEQQEKEASVESSRKKKK